MNPRTQHSLWSGPAGAIEVAIDTPPNQAIQGLAVVAHPHPLFGGTKDNKVVQTLARAFVQMGFITVRFNFRGVGNTAGTHDHGQGEAQDLVWLVQHARATLLPTALQAQPVAMAGFSFGAFVTTHAAQALRQLQVPVGKLALVGAATSRFQLANVPANTLLIHGEVDDTVPLSSVLSWANTQQLPVVVLPGVEHFFHGKLPQLKELIVRLYPSP